MYIVIQYGVLCSILIILRKILIQGYIKPGIGEFKEDNDLKGVIFECWHITATEWQVKQGIESFQTE